MLSLIIISASCTGVTNKSEAKRILDSLKVATKVDSVIQTTVHNALFDTAGFRQAPVKVLRSELYENDYSSFRNLRFTFKNVSDKRISGIKFRWYGLDAFGEPADMGAAGIDGFGGGFDDEGISPGKTNVGDWEILSRNAKKVVLIWPTEVVFSDGSKWKIGTPD